MTDELKDEGILEDEEEMDDMPLVPGEEDEKELTEEEELRAAGMHTEEEAEGMSDFF